MTTQNRYTTLNPQFIKSAAVLKDFPATGGASEYAVLGRSNVGKSSFINHVLGRKGLAKTSNTPGKTSLANFFKIDEGMVWVDLPGYGYAKTSGSEKERWSKLIKDYGEKRHNLSGILWLVDIRHPGMKADLEARAWFETLDVPIFNVLTKTDKLSKQAVREHATKAARELRFDGEPVLYSILLGDSRERFWKTFDKWRTRK